MNVLVSEREIESIKYGTRVGIGKEGACYLSNDDNKLIKLFHSWYKDGKIIDFNVVNSQIAFPIDYLINDNNLVGYTMYYLGGKQLKIGFDDKLELKKLKQAYLQISLIILKLKDIYMYDICLDNILYDYNTNKINIIDTSRWRLQKDGQIDSISEFNWQMMTTLLDTINYKNYKLNRDKELSELYSTYRYSEHLLFIFMEFLNKLEYKVSQYKGEKVKTIKDLKI